ncbi:MAG: methylenetetrahydrofolate reductase [Acidimicrobiia bacterium]
MAFPAAELKSTVKIHEILRQGTTYSFEFFPPKDDEMEMVLARTLRNLAPLAPSFVSVTYGAGGTTRERTHELVVSIDHDTQMTPMAHLTCAGHTRAELVEIVGRYRQAGIENILALGGDPPEALGLGHGELPHAIDLVELVRAEGDFSIGVAAFPEPHPQAESLAADRERTAEKLALADFAITQFFFDAHHYFDLVDSLRALGVDKPVIPGIMPATSIASIARMTKLQGSEFPPWLEAKLRAVEDDPKAVRAVGIDEATKLSRELLDAGAPGLHFITMNRSNATREIYQALGLTRAK